MIVTPSQAELEMTERITNFSRVSSDLICGLLSMSFAISNLYCTRGLPNY